MDIISGKILFWLIENLLFYRELVFFSTKTLRPLSEKDTYFLKAHICPQDFLQLVLMFPMTVFSTQALWTKFN